MVYAFVVLRIACSLRKLTAYTITSPTFLLWLSDSQKRLELINSEMQGFLFRILLFWTVSKNLLLAWYEKRIFSRKHDRQKMLRQKLQQ